MTITIAKLKANHLYILFTLYISFSFISLVNSQPINNLPRYPINETPFQKSQISAVDSEVSNVNLEKRTTTDLSSSSTTDVYQVEYVQPDFGTPVYSQTIMTHEFGNSYGSPFEGTYTPPSSVSFDHVLVRLQASSYGNQFDRLSILYFDNFEIWRSSTAEPGHKNITFEYTKDLTRYIKLFKKSSDITFELNNVLDDTYTGPFDVSLIVDYYKVGDNNMDDITSVDKIYTSDVSPNNLIKLTSKAKYLPDDSIDVKIDALSKNTTRAVVDIFASGASDEEFWYYGDSATSAGRFIELKVNSELTGLILPFPIIYTGGMFPDFWSPIVGINAYDVPSYQIDITPLLPTLWDSSVSISVNVINGYDSTKKIGSSWIVSANLLTWELPNVTGSGDIIKVGDSENYNSTTVFSNPSSNTLSKIEALVFNNSVTSRANLTFEYNDKSSDEFVLESITKSYFDHFSFTFDNSSHTQIGQLSSGFSLLSISSASSSDISTGPVNGYSYLYPLAVNYYTPDNVGNNDAAYVIDILRGYGYYDPNNILWTRQDATMNGTISSSNSYTTYDIKTIQNLNQLYYDDHTNGTTKYTSYNDHNLNKPTTNSTRQNTVTSTNSSVPLTGYSFPSVGSNYVPSSSYGVDDDLSTTLANGAATLLLNKGSDDAVVSTIRNTLNTLLGAYNVDNDSSEISVTVSSKKREVSEDETTSDEDTTTTVDSIGGFLNRTPF